MAKKKAKPEAGPTQVELNVALSQLALQHTEDLDSIEERLKSVDGLLNELIDYVIDLQMSMYKPTLIERVRYAYYNLRDRWITK